MAVVGGYRRFSAGSPPRCRYLPTCSEYAHVALERHGALRGSWLATRRLCRCHPFGSHGFDPVPPSRHQIESSESVPSVPVSSESPDTQRAAAPEESVV